MKREQARLATQRAIAERTIEKNQASEDQIQHVVDVCCRILRGAQHHYLAADDATRRNLNEGVFAHIFINEDEDACIPTIHV